MTLDTHLTSTKKISVFTVAAILAFSAVAWYLIIQAGVNAYTTVAPMIRPLIGL